MLDLSGVPVIDNHCHPLEPAKATLDAEWLAREFNHGMADVPAPGEKKAKLWGATDELKRHFPNIGAVQTMVCQLARVLDCPAELEAVAEARNRRTAEDFAGYARMLYEDAGIVGTVLDSDLPVDAPALKLMPGRLMRLFQMGPALDKLLVESSSYSELRRRYQETLENAVKVEGFVGVKSHLAEKVGFGAPIPSEAETLSAFADAKAGERAGYKVVYMAITLATLLQCQELGVPVHFHCGITGGTWDGPVSDADPFLLAPLLKRPEFLRSKVVLLHGAYPWIQNAAMMSHAFPHVWVDLGWTTPWASLRIVECYRDLIGVAPLSKLMIGSGCHGTPEIAWLAGITAKIGIGKALGDAAELGLMTSAQAERAARMILHDNAAHLYGLGSD